MSISTAHAALQSSLFPIKGPSKRAVGAAEARLEALHLDAVWGKREDHVRDAARLTDDDLIAAVKAVRVVIAAAREHRATQLYLMLSGLMDRAFPLYPTLDQRKAKALLAVLVTEARGRRERAQATVRALRGL